MLPSLAANLNKLPTIIDWVFFVQSLNIPKLSIVCCKTSVILAIPSLYCNSSDNFVSLRLTWHIHYTICLSVQAVLLMSLSFSGQVCCHAAWLFWHKLDVTFLLSYVIPNTGYWTCLCTSMSTYHVTKITKLINNLILNLAKPNLFVIIICNSWV